MRWALRSQQSGVVIREKDIKLAWGDMREAMLTQQSSDWKKTNCVPTTAASEKTVWLFQVYAVLRSDWR